jgi:hypothetical protein
MTVGLHISLAVLCVTGGESRGNCLPHPFLKIGKWTFQWRWCGGKAEQKHLNPLSKQMSWTSILLTKYLAIPSHRKKGCAVISPGKEI